MYYLLIHASLRLAAASSPEEASLESATMLHPGACEEAHVDARRVLECLSDHGVLLSMEFTGDARYKNDDPLVLSWGEESLASMVRKANDAYPGLGLQVLDVGDRLFLTGESCLASDPVILPQTTYANGIAALDAIIEHARPGGFPVSLMQPLNFHDMTHDPRPITFRSAEGSMLDLMDQWLDAYIPHGGRWRLRCNTDMRVCAMTVVRSFSSAVKKDWADLEEDKQH